MSKKKLIEAKKHLEILNLQDDSSEEDEDILELQDKGIEITDEEAPNYRANAKALYVKVPLTEKIKKKLQNKMSYGLYDETIIKDEKNKTVKIPRNVELSSISNQITSELCDRFELCNSDLTDTEWEKLYKTSEYKEREKNVMRKLIAIDINDGDLI